MNISLERDTDFTSEGTVKTPSKDMTRKGSDSKLGESDELHLSHTEPFELKHEAPMIDSTSAVTKRFRTGENEEPTIFQLITRQKATCTGTGNKKARRPPKKNKKNGKADVTKDAKNGMKGVSSSIVIENGEILVKNEGGILPEFGSLLPTTSGAHEHRITSSSFSKRNFSEKWTQEETTKFFKVLYNHSYPQLL